MPKLASIHKLGKIKGEKKEQIILSVCILLIVELFWLFTFFHKVSVRGVFLTQPKRGQESSASIKIARLIRSHITSVVIKQYISKENLGESSSAAAGNFNNWIAGEVFVEITD